MVGEGGGGGSSGTHVGGGGNRAKALHTDGVSIGGGDKGAKLKDLGPNHGVGGGGRMVGSSVPAAPWLAESGFRRLRPPRRR